jgi:hypothetical protein
LFFAIPESLKVVGFESGVLFVVIIATSLIMALALIFHGRRKETEDKGSDDIVEMASEGTKIIDLTLDWLIHTDTPINGWYYTQNNSC